jgi:hypothetical protein
MASSLWGPSSRCALIARCAETAGRIAQSGLRERYPVQATALTCGHSNGGSAPRGCSLVQPCTPPVHRALCHHALRSERLPALQLGPLRNMGGTAEIAGCLSGAGLVAILAVCLSMYGAVAFDGTSEDEFRLKTLSGRELPPDPLQSSEGCAPRHRHERARASALQTSLQVAAVCHVHPRHALLRLLAAPAMHAAAAWSTMRQLVPCKACNTLH